jgi:hypothetical protein
MSKTDATKFLEKVASDPKQHQKSIDLGVNAGAEMGLKFTGPELKQALQEKWGSPSPTQGVDEYYCCYSEPSL